MRINEILVESQQLDEGPLGSLVKAAGRGVGNVIGGVAGAAGAAKGAVKGAVDRAKSSFKAGEKGAYDTLAGKPTAAPASGGAAAPDQTQTNLAKTGNPVGAPSDQAPAAPAEKPGLLKKMGQAVGDFKAGFQQGSGQSTAPDASAPAVTSQAPATNTPAPAAAAQNSTADTQQQPVAKQPTVYAQVKANIDKLDKKGKQRILQALQKQLGTSTVASTPQQQTASEQPPVQQPVVKPRAKKSVNISGRKKAAAPQQQMVNQSKEPKGTMVAESFSIFRKH